MTDEELAGFRAQLAELEAIKLEPTEGVPLTIEALNAHVSRQEAFKEVRGKVKALKLHIQTEELERSQALQNRTALAAKAALEGIAGAWRAKSDMPGAMAPSPDPVTE